MGREDLGPISQYNSLNDPYLQGYYSKSIIRSHLKQTGLINRKGEIIPDEIWKKRIATKERMQQASRVIANRIVQQAIEIKKLEKAELRTTMEILAKKELVRRIRGKSVEARNPPRLWPENSYSMQKPDEDKRNNMIYSTLKNDEHKSIRLVDDDDDFGKRYNSFIQRSKLKQKRRGRGRSQFKRSFSTNFKREPVQIAVTMLYYGKGINIPFDTQVFESKDEISIYQQHCGGENLLVFSGLVETGKKFTFISKRHKEYPFSLSIFINSTYDSRISTCCEYKHKLNTRIGGQTGRFAITNVTGHNPCIKCLLEKSSEKKKKKKNEVVVIKKDAEKNNNNAYDSEFEEDEKQIEKGPVIEIPVRHLNDSDSEPIENSRRQKGPVKTPIPIMLTNGAAKSGSKTSSVVSAKNSSDDESQFSSSRKDTKLTNKKQTERKSSWSSKSSSDDKKKSIRLSNADVIEEINRKEDSLSSKSPKSTSRSVDFSSSSSNSSKSSNEKKPERVKSGLAKTNKTNSSNSKNSEKEKKIENIFSNRPSSNREAPANVLKKRISNGYSSDELSTPKNESRKSTPVKSPIELKKDLRKSSWSSKGSEDSFKNSKPASKVVSPAKGSTKSPTPVISTHDKNKKEPTKSNSTIEKLVVKSDANIPSIFSDKSSSDEESLFNSAYTPSTKNETKNAQNSNENKNKISNENQVSSQKKVSTSPEDDDTSSSSEDFPNTTPNKTKEMKSDSLKSVNSNLELNRPDSAMVRNS